MHATTRPASGCPGQRLAFTAGGVEDVLASGPVLEPVGAVDLILVEQVGQALGELVTLAQVAVVGEEASQRLEMGTFDQSREQTHQTPGQRCLVEQGDFGNFVIGPARCGKACHTKLPWQFHIDGCGDSKPPWSSPEGLRKRLFEPLGDAIASAPGRFVFQMC